MRPANQPSTAPPSPGIGKLEDSRSWLLGGIGTLVAGAIHFAIAPEHFAEAAGQGLFFMVLGTAQFSWAMWHLGRPSFKVWWIGITIAFTSILTWAVSLFIRAPFSNGPENLDYLALFTKLVEVATLVVLAVPLIAAAPALNRARGKVIVTVVFAVTMGLVVAGGAYGAGYGMELVAPTLSEPSEHHHGPDEDQTGQARGIGLLWSFSPEWSRIRLPG